MKYVVGHDGEEREVEVQENEDGTFRVLLDGAPHDVDFRPVGDGAIYSLLLDDHSYELLMVENGGGVSVIHHGLSVDVSVESEREHNARLIAGDTGDPDGHTVTAVMPGIVVAVNVAEGDTVSKGDAVVVLEAMKMENEIRSICEGVVTRVAVVPGDTVNSGDLLVEIE